jgi:hypothetical protein
MFLLGVIQVRAPSGVTRLGLEFMCTSSLWPSHQKSRRLGSQGGTSYATFALYLCSMDKAIAIKAMYGYTGLRVKRAKKWLDGSKMTRSGFLQV